MLKVALDLHVAALLPFARCDGCLYYIYYKVGRRPKKVANKVEKLREAKATTLKRERLARSCAIGGKDVVGEVKGVDSRAGGVGGRTIATICGQFHKLR